MSLLEGDAENILALLRGGDIIGVDPHHVVIALFLGFEDFQRLVGIVGGDHAVRDLVLKVGGGRGVADLAQRGPVAVGAEAVGPPRADIGAGDGAELGALADEIDLFVRLAQGQADGRARGRDMLKGRRGGKPGGLLQLFDKLPGVESVEKIDIAGAAVENRDRQLGAVLHIDLRGLLVGIASVFQFKFFHGFTPFPPAC